jgi:hypothetical protein
MTCGDDTTVTAEVAVLPPAPSVITALPALAPVTMPLTTVATLESEDDQCQSRRMSLPSESFADGVSVAVWPTRRFGTVVGEIERLAMGVFTTPLATVTTTLSLWSRPTTLIVAVPTAIPLTVPPLTTLRAESTVATAGFDDVHLKVAGMAAPFWSVAEATRVVTEPTARGAGACGVIAMLTGPRVVDIDAPSAGVKELSPPQPRAVSAHKAAATGTRHRRVVFRDEADNICRCLQTGSELGGTDEYPSQISPDRLTATRGGG